jgi:type II secretory pathway pseudopilin PulG
MRIDILLKPFKKRQVSTGYTLTELLIGASISVVVIGAAGMALMNLLQGNKTSNIEANRRTEVNRALEFISDEVKKAEAIETDPSANLPTGLTLPTGGQAVLALDLPPNLGQNNPNDKVIYYVAPKPPNNDTWLGPNVIYRYGPPINNLGNYTTGAWGAGPLVDRIDDQTITPSPCTGTAISAKGFAACVNSDKKIAQLYISGTHTGSNEKYQANTQVYARSQANTLAGNSSNKNFGSPPPNPFNPNGQPQTYIIKKIASSMGCNPNGDPCTMTVTFKKKSDDTEILPNTLGNGDLELPNVTEEFYVVVTPSTTGLSDPYTSAEQNNQNPVASTDTNQVILLGDGYDPPSNSAWNPENNSSKFQSLQTILGNQNLIQNNKITLPEKQYLLAFEIGQDDPTHPGFDMQDQVLLITLQ